ncbi:hypothetical protein [Wolbachia endosymbiont of Wuchereria bancrofti]|uniref:hypothetical protein n=1 Tax=Wolbachia endosymbiont of Wuchereria bancrofti TaxID=96496 RepID=UPI000B4DCA5E|nr:hypothetical protein [Wolbachia endosymbiont of Wuchereria bancrofti]OWZ25139.1 hypothetical protein CCY16_00912 [Wolbachia endosymbiont of Wuchereria bancrofti]
MVKGILCDWLGVTELQESQKIDAEQFQRVFSALKKWQEAQKVDTEQFEKVFSALEEKIGTEQFQSMQEYLNGLQKKFTNLEEKVGTLIETVGEQEKIMLTCCIIASVITLATISFITFCIYQGVKSGRERQRSLSDISAQNLMNQTHQAQNFM